LSIIISLGTNLGDREQNLARAIVLISNQFDIIKKSLIYSSPAVDYKDQPDFLNQVIECSGLNDNPEYILKCLLNIEKTMGRLRTVDKGPRIIDLDLLFVGNQKVNSSILDLPHPRLFERSFIVKPLREMPSFSELEKSFTFPTNFKNTCHVFEN
jgi:2-amino-4-hydroxy-6-hydroxymethyldihydropteridine diphosphokinase